MRPGVSENLFSHMHSNCNETMAANAEREPDLAMNIEDSGDEGSLDGFEGRHSEDSDSDVDRVGLEDDGGGPEPGGTDDEEEEAQWTEQLSDFHVPDFQAATGITFTLPANPNPLDYFVEFISDNLWDFIVEETNRCARQKLCDVPQRLAKFVPVTPAEIKAFVGINVIMGINVLPNLALYWSSDSFFGNQGIKKVMPKNRFQEISCYLHFNDSTREPARGTPGFDRLYKIRLILNSVLNKCQSNFKPTKNLSIHEGVISYKGTRESFRQDMAAKPNKHGIKVWMATDSSNGYILNFDVYLGKENDVRRHIYGLGYEVVTKLVRPFMNRNHRVFFDNFFTTTKLLEHLEVNATFACGKVRCNRKDLPACAKDKLQAGEKLVRQKDHVVFTKWRHRQEVSVVSTIVSPLADDVVVNQVVKPVVIDLFNKSMGGIDHADQLRGYYSVGRSCHKCYRHIFWFLIDISICNAFVLCNHHRLGKGQCKLRQLDFRLSLAKQLIGGFSTTVSAAQSSKRRKIEAFALEQGNSSKHFIDKIEGRKRQCVQCKREGAKTPKGRPIETSFECVQCSVALCKEVCFNDYHML